MTDEGSGLDVTARELSGGQKVFGRYTLEKILGRGGMGIVWLARDEELERDVALKFLPDLVVLDKALLGDLKRETRRSLELTHKNIVRIHDFVHDERAGAISMEYIDGDTLSNLRAEKEAKVFQPDEIAAWTSQLCDALDYAHNHARIIHRDLKPANLMVNQKGDLKVSDFGIARSLGDSMSKLTSASGGTSGTLVYMSPQQLDGERGTHLDDVYSLGATLYDLLTSKPPFYSGNVDRQIHERTAPSMTERRKEFNLEPAFVPPAWEETVAACLAKNPAQRPQSTAEIAQRLQLVVPETRRVAASVRAHPKTKLFIAAGIAALLVAAAVGSYFWWQSTTHPVRPATPPQSAASISEKSVAVLPFENLSSDKENAFFAQGMQGEILTSLAKISGLKVISRTSTARYQSRPDNLPAIAAELRVAHIIEGSVQRSGERVRIHVQLIRAATDEHVWAESYDRGLTDIFAIEGEVAKSVAQALHATLTPAENEDITRPPTQNAEAYVFYLRGREYYQRVGHLLEHYQAAERLFEQAIAADPRFAAAWALLARTLININFFHEDSPERRTRAVAAADEAVRLQPDSGEAHRALAAVHASNTERRLAELQLARRALPNDPEIIAAIAATHKKQGKWAEARAGYERAVALGPNDSSALESLAIWATDVRDWPTAAGAYDRILALNPDATTTRFARAWMDFLWRDDLRPTKEILAAIPPGTPDPGSGIAVLRADVALLERNYDLAEQLYAALPLEEIPGAASDRPLPKSFLQAKVGLARRGDGDLQRAEEYLQKARLFFEAQIAEDPVNPWAHADLSQVYAGLGWRNAALGEAFYAAELCPESTNAYEGPTFSEQVAWVYSALGEADAAIPLLDRLLRTPAGTIRAYLRHDPQWDPIRNDPRFQAIVSGPEPKTIY